MISEYVTVLNVTLFNSDFEEQTKEVDQIESVGIQDFHNDEM